MKNVNCVSSFPRQAWPRPATLHWCIISVIVDAKYCLQRLLPSMHRSHRWAKVVHFYRLQLCLLIRRVARLSCSCGDPRWWVWRENIWISHLSDWKECSGGGGVTSVTANTVRHNGAQHATLGATSPPSHLPPCCLLISSVCWPSCRDAVNSWSGY